MRYFLPALLLSLFATGGPAHATSQYPGFVPGMEPLRFDVLRNGDDFGTHEVDIKQREDGAVEVTIDINLRVGLGPITLFRYEHNNREVWRDGRLISLDTTTYDDGDEYSVQARAEDGRIEVTGSGGEYDVPASTLPSSYWNYNTVRRDVLLNTQKGGMMPISVENQGIETIEVQGEQVEAERFHLTGEFDITIWYAVSDKRWLKMITNVRGQRLDYIARHSATLQGTGQEASLDDGGEAR